MNYLNQWIKHKYLRDYGFTFNAFSGVNIAYQLLFLLKLIKKYFSRFFSPVSDRKQCISEPLNEIYITLLYQFSSMLNLVVGSFIISVLHGLLPNHWLPIVTVGKNRNWSDRKVLRVTGIAAMAHTGSTILLGVLIAYAGQQISETFEHFTYFIAPAILIIIGLWFIIQHYRHKHFHLNPSEAGLSSKKSERQLIMALAGAMFFSPCLEIEGIYLQAGAIGWDSVLYISLIYFIFSISGMVLWVFLSLQGIKKLDWHRIEHASGIISGVVLIILGLLFFVIH